MNLFIAHILIEFSIDFEIWARDHLALAFLEEIYLLIIYIFSSFTPLPLKIKEGETVLKGALIFKQSPPSLAVLCGEVH